MNYEIKRTGKTRNLYLGISLFIGVFGFVYEIFSHGVYSAGMMFAFLLPLLLVAVPYGGLNMLLRAEALPLRLSEFAGTIYRSAVLTATVGMLFHGVLSIYGTTNKLVYLYPITALVLFFVALIVITGKQHKSESEEKYLINS